AAFALYNCPLAEPPRRTTFSSLVPCKDGFFAFQVSEQHQWEGMKAMMGNPEWSRDPKFEIITDGVANWEEFEPGFLEWTAQHTRYEILELGQSLRVPVFPLNDVAELQRDPQQQFRKFFRPTSVPGANGPVAVPGANVHLRETPARNDPGTSWSDNADA
ncbi:MAG: CoA transferase, partial [Hyphomicrobiales bacterium]